MRRQDNLSIDLINVESHGANESSLQTHVKRSNQMLTIPSERLGHTLVQYHESAMLIGGEVLVLFCL